MKELENEVVRVHEDDEWLLVRPTTFLASKKYGANTKWCTTSESNPEYFLKYSERGVLIYCMNKKTGYKVASFYSLKSSDPEFSFWNQKDTKIESMDSELSDSMLRIIRDVSKDPNAVSNRRLLETEQLEKENKSLRKWMSMDSINHIVREFAMDSKPKVKESRLSRRIQNALRRDEDELSLTMEPSEEIDLNMDSVNVQDSPSYDMGGISETTVFEEPRDL
jgi:DNA-directed RNA polymerase delta subunit